MQASDQLDAPATLSQRKELPALKEEAGWAQRATLDVLEYFKISLCCQDPAGSAVTTLTVLL